MFGDEESIHSGTSVPSIGEDAQDPQVRHLIIGDECCRAIYRSSDGNNYICPRVTEDCQKRNHIRIRVTHRGELAIYAIHRGTRGGFRGVLADARLSPEEHQRLIQEARERNRASAALAAGAGTLTGAPRTVAAVPPPALTAPLVMPPNPPLVPPPVPQTEADLLAMIASLQEQLRLQTSSAGPVSGAIPHGRPAPASLTGGIPPAITVTTPMRTHLGALGNPGAPGTPLGTTPSPAPAASATPGVSFAASLSTAGTAAQPGATATGDAAPVLSAADRWYAVIVGRTPSDAGVYQGYLTVVPLVVGVSGAVYRGGFKTKAEAESYLGNIMAIPVTTTPSRKQKWYVIAVGQDPSDRGVYDNWPDVAPKVMGVSGAVYQGGFKSQSEAEVSSSPVSRLRSLHPSSRAQHHQWRPRLLRQPPLTRDRRRKDRHLRDTTPTNQ
jgi:hypothetical protein